ncbi:vesicle transport v-SNARE 11 [Trypanosoma theileri]|uniref:Vesicle transport v-SNARE 11 n=1 Tax=Trypanosoma theileri TaxID=67003 RepID=A0A1X0NY79_9TRYP|nr:vesicle transport v-SNARE 11 [Trypanosoma theileri]ORC89120.1 vesicle transport v-SNARE 11 [Trypanosoma theileri]
MSTLFQSYEEEYRDVVKNIQDGMTELRATLHRSGVDGRGSNGSSPAVPATGPGSRLQRGSQLTALITQVKELLNNMEYECNDVAVEQRPLLKERLTDCRKNARRLEEEIAKLRAECAAADREDLMGATAKKGTGAGTAAAGSASNSLGLDDETAKHRLQMMQNTERVKQASNTLLRAEKLLNETEETGTAALGNLRTQTETLHRINATTIEVNEEISEARKILTRMQRTMVKHKIMLVGIILVLLFLIFVALYVSVSKNERQKQVQPAQNSTPAPPLPTWSPGSGGGIPTD